eukprot:gnl/MRDRNA2_/MRDRNA2_20982_c0_seq2.p1 gnl/MRDRNA2_/MRDRNA2_20982_c0~~gnl/MRDRNA2_/MRDRNA2_20982_c0_seq2.p1  ORF type:complete len:388 (+),score=71.24 gnl/MRDRNA2_/MRDRNA2_20982_c0_seq2:143-1165(+)
MAKITGSQQEDKDELIEELADKLIIKMLDKLLNASVDLRPNVWFIRRAEQDNTTLRSFNYLATVPCYSCIPLTRSPTLSRSHVSHTVRIRESMDPSAAGDDWHQQVYLSRNIINLAQAPTVDLSSFDSNDPVDWVDLGSEGGGEVNGKMYNQWECYEKALSLDPKDAIAWFNLGTGDGGKVNGQSYSGKECLEKSLTFDAEDSDAWINLGTMNGGQVSGQNYDAKQCYEKALSVDPEHGVCWFNLGSYGGGEVNGDTYSAKECYEKSLSANFVDNVRDDAAAWARLGEEGGGRVDLQRYSAEECYREALALDPEVFAKRLAPSMWTPIDDAEADADDPPI